MRSIRRIKYRKRERQGTVIVLAVFSLAVLMGFAALVVDLGYIHSSRDELQRSADAAALAACWDLGDEFAKNTPIDELFTNVTLEASNFASNNDVTNSAPSLATRDVTFGYLRASQLANRSAIWDTTDPSTFNAVRVHVQRTSSVNGQINSFFARAFGVDGIDAEATATAVILRSIAGFEIPSDGSHLMILPFALDLETWNDMMAGGGTDGWAWDPETKQCIAGESDLLREVNLYPQNTGAPGNRGTVDIGGANNSTTDIARQILEGISPADMTALNKPLTLEQGPITLNGDTGISAGVKDELKSIIGKTRIIPIFSEVNGPGNNAEFTIVHFCGVRIMGVQLTGPRTKKHLTIQPAPISSKGIVPGEPVSGQSDYVYSQAFLVR